MSRNGLAHLLKENQISIVFLGILAGLLFPRVFTAFHPWNTLLLQVIFFLSALRIDLRDLLDQARDWKTHLLAAAFMLVVLPIGVYFPVLWLAPSWALPFLIAMATPTGMTIALIADYFGGRASLAIMIVIVTSMLAPFTIPILMEITIGRTVEIDAFEMFRSLAEAIILPFFISWMVARAAPKFVRRHDASWRSASIAVFGILIASIVSKTVGTGSEGAFEALLTPETAQGLLTGFAMIAGITYLAYRLAYWEKPAERVTIALCLLYMNFTLCLYLADRFFAEEQPVPKLVLILIILNAMLPGIKTLAARVTHFRWLPGRG